MMNPAIEDFLTSAAHAVPGGPDTPLLSELTDQGVASTSRTEFHGLVERVARRAGGLSGTVAVTVLDASTASIAVLLGLLGASVDVLVVEAGNSHLADRESVIWTVGARTLVGPASDGPHPWAGLTETTYDALLAPVNQASDPLRDAPPPGPGPNGARPAGAGSAPRMPAVLLLTSGAAGEPRIVRQPLDSVLRGGALYRRVFGYRRGDRILLPVPIAHSFGLVGGVLATLGAGAELRTMPAFSVSRLLHGIETASALLGSPLVYTMLARAWRGSASAPRLRLLVSSGGPIAEEVGAEVRRLTGVAVRQAFGSTETGLIAAQGAGARTWHPRSVGTFAPGVQWCLSGDRAADRTAGESGTRLLVRTTTMFTGYVGAEPAPRPDGLYETGDLAEVTESGEVFLVGRKATFINVGGKKANPRRVERVISDHPDVAEVHVFGVAAHHEQAVHAAVVAAPRTGVVPADLAAFCRGRLAAHEVPHRIHVVPTLPRDSLGKVDHAALLAASGKGL